MMLLQFFMILRRLPCIYGGRSCTQHMVLVPNEYGNTLIPLEMTKYDVESIRLIIDSFEG